MRLRAWDPLVDALFGRRFPRWDAAMATIAVIDLVVLTLRRELPLTDEWAFRLLVVDWAVLALFAGDFLVSLARAQERVRFLRANWYILVSLFPLPIALLRAFQLGRIPHILIWGTRFPHEAEEAFGGAYVLQVIREHEKMLVQDLTDPLLVRLLEVLRTAVKKGRYAQAFGEGLEKRRPRIRAAIVDGLESKPALRMLLYTPGAERALREVQNQLVDVLVATLTNPELDAVIRESMDEGLAELQARIAERAAEAEAAAAEAGAPPPPPPGVA